MNETSPTSATPALASSTVTSGVESAAQSRSSTRRKSVMNPFRSVAVWASILVLAGSAIALPATISALRLRIDKKPIFPQTGLTVESIPTESESFIRVGTDVREEAEVESVLGTKNYVTRAYAEKRPREGKPPRVIQFHAAYYTGSIDTVPHVPDRCFVGGGMQIGEILGDLPITLSSDRWRNSSGVPEHLKGKIKEVRLSNAYSAAPGTYVRLPRDVESLKMRSMRFLSEGQTIYAGYFFIANGGHTPRSEGVRLLAFNLNDKYAYYLKVQFTVSNIESGDDLTELATKFLDEMLGEIMRCVPDWSEVESGAYPPGNTTNSMSTISSQTSSPSISSASVK